MEKNISKKFALGMLAGVMALTTAVYMPSGNTYADSIATCTEESSWVDVATQLDGPDVWIMSAGCYTVADGFEKDFGAGNYSGTNEEDFTFTLKGLGTYANNISIGKFAHAEIVDGTYTGTLSVQDNGTIEISGGVFNTNPITAGITLADGYNINEANGKFYVEPDGRNVLLTVDEDEAIVNAEIGFTASVEDSKSGLTVSVVDKDGNAVDQAKYTLTDTTVTFKEAGTFVLKAETTFKNSDTAENETSFAAENIEVYDTLGNVDTDEVVTVGGSTIEVSDVLAKVSVEEGRYKNLTITLADEQDEDYFTINEDGTITVADIDTENGYGKMAFLVVQISDGLDTNVSVQVPVYIEISYDFSEDSQDQVWDRTTDAKSGLTFTIDKEYAYMLHTGEVMVLPGTFDSLEALWAWLDENITSEEEWVALFLDSSAWTATKGSLILTLTPEYLASLEDGNYTLVTYLMNDATPMAHFSVVTSEEEEEATSNTSKSVKTVTTTTTASTASATAATIASPDTATAGFTSLPTKAKTIAMAANSEKKASSFGIVAAIAAVTAGLAAAFYGIRKKIAKNA